MRLWSLHPSFLDAKGLVALWREGLLAKKVLEGKTKGYKNHPQLIRFRESEDPSGYINNYLHDIWREAETRGYHFNRLLLGREKTLPLLKIRKGQILYEIAHLKEKLKTRDPQRAELLEGANGVKPHPLFRLIPGGVETWEVLNHRK